MLSSEAMQQIATGTGGDNPPAATTDTCTMGDLLMQLLSTLVWNG